MKKIIILILTLIIVSCSDNPTEVQTKDYPISHKSIAVDIAIKINQMRRLNGLEEFIYVDDASYTIDGITTNFNEHTSQEEDKVFIIDDTYELQTNDTVREYITRWRVYYDNTEDLLNKIVESNQRLTERVEGGETTIAINIVERASSIPEKVAIDFYVYFIVRDF